MGEPSARGLEALGSINGPAPVLGVTCTSSLGFFTCKTKGLDWFGDCKYMTQASTWALPGQTRQGVTESLPALKFFKLCHGAVTLPADACSPLCLF